MYFLPDDHCYRLQCPVGAGSLHIYRQEYVIASPLDTAPLGTEAMINPATPNTRDLARRLLAYEAAMGTLPPLGFPAAFGVCEKLRRPLTALAGTAGFRSLLSRALTLAKRESPALGAIQVKADGSLDSSSENGVVGPSPDKHDPDAEKALVANLLGLLFTFIGEPLTLRLIHDVWPSEFFIGSTAEGTGEDEKYG
jgi:hypothetical protein